MLGSKSLSDAIYEVVLLVVFFYRVSFFTNVFI